MAEIMYPVGYGTELVTMAELRRRHEPNMHPEYARRLFSWLESKGGLIGIGGGFRPLGTQPDKPGFAAEGKSFHQPQAWPDAPSRYAAVDLVVQQGLGAKHRAPRWQEVPHKGSAEQVAWGLWCNVYPSEAWHLQPIEISGWQTWVNKGRPGLQVRYPIPAGIRKVLAPAPTQKKRTKLTEFLNDKGEVAALQNFCIWWKFNDDQNRPLIPDGKYGDLTVQAVKRMQRAVGAFPDGEYGPKSAGHLQRFLDAMAKLAAGA